ncbi:MAG: N-acetyltransferase [Rhizobacter sp.]|nr:N-acetyltransferase [Ferruginibacter sp.]
MTIKSINEQDYPEVSRIYLNGIATGNATFQTTAPTWKEWDDSHVEHCRIGMAEGGKMLGWAALTAVSGRCVYAGVAEVSVYVDEAQRGKGIGKLLLNELIQQSEAGGIWTLQAGIFPENTGSIKLHQNGGFRIIGYRERIGNMNGVWRNNLILERRSKIVGL